LSFFRRLANYLVKYQKSERQAAKANGKPELKCDGERGMVSFRFFLVFFVTKLIYQL